MASTVPIWNAVELYALHALEYNDAYCCMHACAPQGKPEVGETPRAHPGSIERQHAYIIKEDTGINQGLLLLATSNCWRFLFCG
jgi:hypothetical protein